MENYSFLSRNNFVAYGRDSPDAAKLGKELSTYFNNIGQWQDEAAILQKHIDEDFNIFKIAASITDLYRDLINDAR
jgi:hypothetical protein